MKIHIVGMSGSGKTTLARWIGSAFRVPAFDLDPIVYDQAGERPATEIVRRIEEIRRLAGWVTEGAYRDAWLRALLDDSVAIVWLDPSLTTAIVRMVKRHVRAEFSGNNLHPGWGRLLRFLNYNRRTAHQQATETLALLEPYSSKVFRCRSSGDIAAFKRRVRVDDSRPTADDR